MGFKGISRGVGHGFWRERPENLSADPDQAVALRRRRLRHPVAPLADPVEFAGLPLRPRPRLRSERDVLGARYRRSTSRRSTRPTRASARTRIAQRIDEAGRGMVMLVGVQSNQFPRALDIATAPARARASRRHRRLPRLRHARHAARRSTPTVQRGARHRLLHVCRRGRGRPARPRPERRGQRPPQADLQLHERPAGHRARADAAPAGLGDQAHLRREHQLRRRARLPVPVLVLHHHQRAGAEVAPPLAGRRRAHRARRTPRRASSTSSSPTTTSPATRTGSRSSTA